MHENIDGPWRLRYENVDDGSIHTRGFPTNSARFDFAGEKGIRVIERLDPPNTPLAPPQMSPSDHANSTADRLVQALREVNQPDPYQAVYGWIDEHSDQLQFEATRRRMDVPELVVWLLEDSLAVYADETDLDIAEQQREQAVQEAKSRAAEKATNAKVTNCDPTCDADKLEFVAHYGAPGIGQEWRCTVCGRSWAKVGGGLFDPADGYHIQEPGDTV